MTRFEYIHFTDVTPPDRKTGIWDCVSNRGMDTLGQVKWFGRWRQYCFYPFAGTIFNRGCLSDINWFMDQLMQQRKNPS